MEKNRDFKGIWISKTIWTDKELSAIDKVILAEIDSLDCEGGCYASNEYLAEFCQCSTRKVTESISKLIKMEYIEQVSFNGRQRVLRSNLQIVKSLKRLRGRLAKSARQTSKNCEAKYNNIIEKKEKEKTRTNEEIKALFESIGL